MVPNPARLKCRCGNYFLLPAHRCLFCEDALRLRWKQRAEKRRKRAASAAVTRRWKKSLTPRQLEAKRVRDRERARQPDVRARHRESQRLYEAQKRAEGATA